MRLIIASNNAHKVREIKEILGDYFSEILSLKEAGIAIDVEEDGETFEQNALKKAQEVLKIADADAALSDDSGWWLMRLTVRRAYTARASPGKATTTQPTTQSLWT